MSDKSKLFKELDILILEFGQSTVILDPYKDNKHLLEEYFNGLKSKRKILYIDFKTIHNMYAIPANVTQRYLNIFKINTKIPYGILQ